MKKYKLITEVSPIQIEIDSAPTDRTWEEILKEAQLAPLQITRELSAIQNFVTETISEETFKILSNICNIEMDKYGERTYICNNIKMKIEGVNE